MTDPHLSQIMLKYHVIETQEYTVFYLTPAEISVHSAEECVCDIKYVVFQDFSDRFCNIVLICE